MRFSCLACATCSIFLALTFCGGAIALALGGVGWVIAWSGLGVSAQLPSPRCVVGAPFRSTMLWQRCADKNWTSASFQLRAGELPPPIKL
ncbi:MFS transporter [Bradyrhizobium sp. LMTR 3]|uniref:MFS transporter n=1 Tax=Bradyrhizobium sp. LMTR 3 TaxID=189873 RepID=UPI001FD9C6D0|nr:MFS transporter [Bradyrhizobium sp. LMTR 3]